MQLFYFPEVSQNTSEYQFPKQEARHLIKVLRKKTGDKVNFTDGRGNLYSGSLVIHGNFCKLENIQSIQPRSETFVAGQLPYHLHIAIAPTKSNDRTEWFLEKSVELGVTRITPILCEHSERNKIRKDRFEKIMVSAMKQSQRLCLPQLDPLTPLDEFIDNEYAEQKLIAHLERGNEKELAEVLDISQDTIILIGPEGDFSNQEIDMALKKNYKPVRLGSSRLRTETAGVYAVGVMKTLWDRQH